MTLSDNINEEKNKVATPTAWLVLLDIELTNNERYRLARNDEDVLFGLESYADAGLAAYYKLDETDGIVAVDSVAANNGDWISADLVINGDFATDTDWTKGGTWTIGSGVATRTASASGTNLSQSSSIEAGKQYTIEFDFVRTAGVGGIRGILGGNDAGAWDYSASGHYTATITTDNWLNDIIYVKAGDDWAGTVDNVVVTQNIVNDGDGIVFNGIQGSDSITIPYQNIGTTISYVVRFKRTSSQNTRAFSYMRTFIEVRDSSIRWYPDADEAPVDAAWVSDSEWHQLVVTQTGTVARIYLDSVLIGSDDSAPVVDTANLSNKIGRYRDSDTQWEGSLSDVRIYNKVLSQTEIDNIYNNGVLVRDVPIRYTAFNFQLEPTTLNSKGKIPTVTLRVSNVTNLLQADLQELNGGVGSDVTITVVNSGLLTEDFSDLVLNYEVLESSSTSKWIDFILGSPSPLRQPFPLNRYKALSCGWRFESVECAYARKTVVGVTLSNPVSLEITAHDFEADDAITLHNINGITGGIEGNYLVKAATDVDNATIKTLAGADVDGGDFGGAYTSGGQAGYTTCARTLKDCRIRENSGRFGGEAGMRSGGVRIA